MSSQICYDGPAWAEVFHHRMDGSSFPQTFPWELTNTEYYGRVLKQVGYALQRLVEATVKAYGVVDVDVQDPKKRRQLEAEFTKNGFRVVSLSSGAIVFKSQNPRGQIGVDAFLLMKHILFDRGTTCHTTFYVTQMSAACPTLSVGDLKGDLKSVPPPPPNKARLSRLMECRNNFAHMSLTSDTDWLTYDKMKSIFADALFVVERVGEYLKTEKGLTDNYAAANMKRLEKQWETHTANKYQRQIARPAIDSWKLFVGNLPAGAMGRDEKTLVDHLNKKMYDAGLRTAPGHPVISCNISKGGNGDYAFVKLRSVQETNNCLSLKDLIFKNCKLKIGRPKNDKKLYVASLLRGLEDVAVALGASLADDAARQGVWSQLGEDAQEVLRALCAAGHSACCNFAHGEDQLESVRQPSQDFPQRQDFSSLSLGGLESPAPPVEEAPPPPPDNAADRRFMPVSEGVDLSKLVELRTLEGHSGMVRRAESAFCSTFVMMCLRRRSGALPCFRTGGALFLVQKKEK
jgi:hypothetical protein